MKVTRSYTLDTEILHELDMRGINKSKLINDLLRLYLQKTDKKIDMDNKEINDAILEKKLILNSLEKRKKEIEDEKKKEEEKLKEEIDNGGTIIIE